ncbi:hypothetical protein HanXRQr2_Chr05g0217461 [Helianthus annuus]|uniref:Uncharacterized protein n=1 Tax=Helianthus annuus TaxID=4232 RepID=A0A9K3J1M4_HELAN|nr:hypothetical protein HanXRQr2_Chr05g0217461 [Helianthus annuus]KAJ0584764.1 hypothetical protein HanHA89_Chr05g0192481 [Helianthus annuus]KAJ0750422.1 hypothetical protein HanLR1_Chr05g0181801 [Helianthus annuus]
MDSHLHLQGIRFRVPIGIMTVTRFILYIMTVISRSKSTDMTNYGFSSSLGSTSSLIQSNLLHQKALINWSEQRAREESERLKRVVGCGLELN